MLKRQDLSSGGNSSVSQYLHNVPNRNTVDINAFTSDSSSGMLSAVNQPATCDSMPDVNSASSSSNGQPSDGFAAVVKNNPPVAQDTEDANMGFKQVTHKKKKKKFVVGSSSDSGTQFQGVVKKYVFCLNRVKSETTEAVVIEYLKSRDIPVMSCYIVKNTRNDYSDNTDDEHSSPRYIRMRVCISQSDVQKIYNPKLWPDGVTVRPWSFKQRTPQ